MRRNIPDGVWPTMITPYTSDNKIDWKQTENLIEWYIESGMTGIFAVCQSSEMYFLSREERIELCKFVVEKVNGRIGVVASGLVSEKLDEQIEDAKAIADCGPDAVVFLRNRLSDDFAGDIEKITAKLDNSINLGVYECPYPFVRHLTDDEVKILADSGRFTFLKDTCCDAEKMRRRREITSGSDFKLYNANAATFYESINFGYNGYCGVMTNFHPDIYSWVYNHRDDERCKLIEKFLGITSIIECRGYPICAKTYLAKYEKRFSDMLPASRSSQYKGVPALSDELGDLYFISEYIRNEIIGKN